LLDREFSEAVASGITNLHADVNLRDVSAYFIEIYKVIGDLVENMIHTIARLPLVFERYNPVECGIFN